MKLLLLFLSLEHLDYGMIINTDNAEEEGWIPFPIPSPRRHSMGCALMMSFNHTVVHKTVWLVGGKMLQG